jgi:MoaA/NifB/PqqE/SkfB family radical SAM enzyme
LESELEQGRMTPELYRKIVDELAGLAPRRISPYLMNEPLLDPRLPEFVRYTTERVPEATTLITTNGTRLTEAFGAALIDAGLKRVKVSLQSLDPETNKRLMGDRVDSAEVVRNVIAFHRVIREKRAKQVDLRVSMIVTRYNQAEIDAARRFWRKQGIRLVTSALENRGGNIAEADALNPHEMARLNGDCTRPSKDMCILWNGDAVLCCVDWWRTTIVGNVAEQSIREIWNGPRLTEIRKALRENDCSVLPKICACCAQSADPHRHRRGFKGLVSRWFGAKPAQ